MKLPRKSIALAFALLAADSEAVTFADGAHHVIDAGNSFPLEGVIVDDGPGGSQTTLEVLEGGEIATAFEAYAGLLVRGRSVVRIVGGTVGNVFYGLDVHDDAQATISGGIVTRVDLGDGFGATGAPYLSIEGGNISGNVDLTLGSLVRISGGTIRALTGSAASIEISGGSFRFDVSVSGETSLDVSGGQLGGLRIHRGVQARVTGGSIRGVTVISAAGIPFLQTHAELSGGVFGDDVTVTDGADLLITGGVYNGNVYSRRGATLTIVGREFNAPFGPVPPPGFHLIGLYANGGGFNAVVSHDTASSARLVPDPLLLLEIDIRPRTSANVIRLGREKNVLVAVLGSATADVDHLDLASLAFGPGAAQPIHDLTRRAVYARHRKDWNADGFPDLTLHFRADETGLESYHDRACLAGEIEGKPFLACDAVEVRDLR